MLTLEEISLKYHISKRTLETNVSILKEEYVKSGKMIYNGQKWLISTDIIKAITQRKYAKHIVNYDNGLIVDNVDLKGLVNEKDLKTFLTIAPKQIHSTRKIEGIVKTVFDYLHTNSTENEPTIYIYSHERNSDYLNERGNQGYHIHAVSTATYSPTHKENIYNILTDILPSDKIHATHTVQVVPYVLGLGIGAVNYTLKEATHTGAYIQ